MSTPSVIPAADASFPRATTPGTASRIGKTRQETEPSRSNRIPIYVGLTAAIIAAVVVFAVVLPSIFPSAGECPPPPVRSLNGSPPPLSLRPDKESSTSTSTNTSWEVQQACYGLMWASLTALVENRTGSPMASGWSLAGQSSSGVTIVTYDSATSAWIGPATQPIQLWDLLTVQTSGPLYNTSFILVLNGTGQFTGTLSWTASGT